MLAYGKLGFYPWWNVKEKQYVSLFRNEQNSALKSFLNLDKVKETKKNDYLRRTGDWPHKPQFAFHRTVVSRKIPSLGFYFHCGIKLKHVERESECLIFTQLDTLDFKVLSRIGSSKLFFPFVILTKAFVSCFLQP